MSKNYLITGAGRGIGKSPKVTHTHQYTYDETGRGLSRLLLQKGNRVFMLDNNESEMEHLKKQLPKWFPSDQTKPQLWKLHKADMSNKTDIEQAVQSASTFFNGQLDVLINNAGVTTGVTHSTKIDQEAFLELWEQSIKVNLTGTMLITRACLPLLRRTTTQEQQSQAKGNIIILSSTRAHQSEPNSESYATTKAGLLGLSQSLSCSLATDNISVNAILPGWINVAHESREGDEKEMKWEDGLTKEDHEWHFSGRVGMVEDILRAVEFLVDASGFVTGLEVRVDGGVARRMVYPE